MDESKQSNKNFTLDNVSIQATHGDGSLTQHQMEYTLSQDITTIQTTESKQMDRQGPLEQEFPELPKSRSISLERNNRPPCLPSLKKYISWGNIFFFLPNLIELGVIGYGIGLYCSSEIEQGLTFMITFGAIFIVTVLIQCCMCKQGRVSFKKGSQSSVNNGNVEEVDVITDENCQASVTA